MTQLTKALDEEKKKRESRPSLVERLTRYTEPFVISSHEECVRLMLADVAAGKVTFDVMPTYDGDLSRQHEYYITETLFGQRPVFVRYFPRVRVWKGCDFFFLTHCRFQPIKAFYMPLIHTDAHGVERVDCYDLLFPFVGEVVGGSQRTHVAAELVQRMQQLKMDLKVNARVGACFPPLTAHAGAAVVHRPAPRRVAAPRRRWLGLWPRRHCHDGTAQHQRHARVPPRVWLVVLRLTKHSLFVCPLRGSLRTPWTTLCMIATTP